MPNEYSPGSREIVATVIELWQKDPRTEHLSYSKLLACVKEYRAESLWVLSEKRLKAALKEFNIQQNQPKFTYVKQTKSNVVPNITLPFGTQLQQVKGKGKALYSTRSFRKGEKIWDEVPLVHTGKIEMLQLMRSGRACASCSKLLQITPDGKPLPRAGVACVNCRCNWCSNNCKKIDIGHAVRYHASSQRGSTKPTILSSRWKLYEQFCLEQNWNAGYLYAMALLYKVKNKPNSQYTKSLDAMAKISQEYRQQAVSDKTQLEWEQHEQMWKRGHKLLASAFQKVYELSYDEYLEGIGMVAINNVKGCIFEIQSILNHSCEPNVSVEFKSDSKSEGITVKARTDIEAGQELLITYVDPSLEFDERQYQLRTNWGFICSCERCKLEKATKLNPNLAPANTNTQQTAETDESSKNSNSVTKPRRKSVRFDKPLVSLEVSS